MKYPLLLAAIAAGAATPTFAQDLSGIRVEGRIGWEQVGADARYPNPDEDEDEDGDEFLTGSEKDSALTYGAELGYDVQLGGVVLGAYAGADMSDSGSCGEVLGDDAACASLDRTFTLGVRAGVPLGESALLYAKGGYSNGKFEASYDSDVTDNDEDEPGEILEFSDKQDGYHVGGGIEVGLTSNVYAKLEYLYTDFGSSTFILDEDEPGLDLGSDRHQAVVGIGVRF